MNRALPRSSSLAVVALVLGTACSSEDGDDTDGTGGYPGTGGFVATGGAVGTGGAAPTGGTTATGGVVNTGGITNTGGLGGAGGGPSTGGAGTGGAGTGGAGTGGAGTGGAGTGGAGTGGAGTGGAATGGTAGSGGGGSGDTSCCSGKTDCVCRDAPPAAMTSANGKYTTQTYTVPAGCIYYPTNAEGKFSAIALSDGYLGSGGCGPAQVGRWGGLLASYGIVVMVINTGGQDQPATRGQKLLGGIAAFKTENTKSGGQLFGKLNGRYATGGFSMGGGGTTRATVTDKTLKASLAIMPYSPDGAGVVTPTLVICGQSDNTASCASHGTPVYNEIPSATPKMRVTVSGGHVGQPTAGGGDSGEWGLAFLKLYLDGDERWKPVLLAGSETATNIQ